MSIDEKLVQTVWEKGRGTPDRDSTQWRQDQCGAWLHREQYNNSNSEYGWKVVSVVPGGGNNADDLQPFHCNNNFNIANGRPQCHVTAEQSNLAPGQHVDQPRNTSK